MPRAVAFSAKQKRAQILDKRAVKRGDLDPAELRVSNNITVASAGPVGGSRYARTGGSKSRTSRKAPRTALSDQSMHTTRLVSTFVCLTPEYMEETRDEAYRLVLPRPIAEGIRVFPVEIMERDNDGDGATRLVCPARPKFSYDMTKDEVERNEGKYFADWLEGVEDTMRRWVATPGQKAYDHAASANTAPGSGALDRAGLARHSPTWFETNLEVWRQLWRVTETSHILLVLLDTRCPPIHLPHSLRSYLQNLQPRKEVILVLTKADLVDPTALNGWKDWLRSYWQSGLDDIRAKAKNRLGRLDKRETAPQVIAVTSYDRESLSRGKTRHSPDLAAPSLYELTDALSIAHERIRASQAPMTRLPRAGIDWDLLRQGPLAADAMTHSSSSSGSADDLDVSRHRSERDSQPLTIGLIGQPNVGKSSLLNALLGETRVKASKTPGKTKHFQTMFWGWKRHAKIVDCPGLVCPSLVGLEIQALCGVLPISQIPSLPACISTAAHLLPLERIYRIPKPTSMPSLGDAVTKTSRFSGEEYDSWTPAMIMEGRAIDRGYITAKTGRPDIHRAANDMMRQLAEGKIRWCFLPPAESESGPHGYAIPMGIDRPGTEGSNITDGNGLWLHELVSEAGLNSETRQGRLRGQEGTASSSIANGISSDPSDEVSSGLEFTSDWEGEGEDYFEDEDAKRQVDKIERSFFSALEIGTAG